MLDCGLLLPMNHPLRALYLDVKFPRPDRDSASIRATQCLGFLASRGPLDMASLTYHGLDGPASSAVEGVARFGARLVCPPGMDRIREFLRDEGAAYHTVVFAWSRTATALMAAVRDIAPQAYLVFDTVDVNHVRLFRQARATGNARRMREALSIREAEKLAMSMADLTIAITDADRDVLRALMPEARVETVSQWHEPVALTRVPSAAPTVLFVGYYQAAPNQDLAPLLAHEVMPAVWAQFPAARLCLAGSEPGPEILVLAGPGVEVPGWEADLGPRLAAAHVYAAPLRFGAGIKGKILQAMAWGIPLVASSVAVEGIGLVPERDFILAESPAACAEGILRILTAPALGGRLAAGAGAVLRARFSRQAVLAQYAAAFAGAPGFAPSGLP